LSKVVYPEGEESFEYDFAGNRINRTMKGITTRYNYDNRNRLIEKIEGGMQTSYRYDPQGNLLEEEGRRGTTRYTYDCFNRTESVRTAEGGYVRNRYDAEGLRYELYENGKVSRFIFSGREVVTEVDADYGLKAAIIRGHELLAQKDNKDSYYYLNNAHGDVTALVDGRGDVVNRYRYDAFGNTVEAVEKVQNRFRYAGEQFDPVTGQYYLRARFYNPVIGRFTQEDTYRGDGLNLYAYVANNPVNYYDPSGYSCEFKTIVIKTEGIEEQLDFLEQNIHGFSREQGRALLEYAFNPERNLSVVFGGSRIRGNYSPTSDLDVGVGSLTTSQAGRIIKKANKVEGGLPLKDNINCNWE
jgi:RHS repeat-associated protein